MINNLNKKNFLIFFLLFISYGCEKAGSQEEPYIDPHIIFTSRRWWNYDIYITDIYGENITHLTKNQWLDFNPAVSPDGNKIAFVSDRDGNREIYILDLFWLDGYTQWEGKNLINITNSPEHDWSPIFSPTSEKIVYSTYFPLNDNYDIFTMNFDGSEKTNITNSNSYEKYPQFSPDGSFVIYQAWQKGVKEIYFANLLDKNNINLTQNSSSNDIITNGNAMSPDGQKIVFTSERDGNKNIYVMNVDGSNHIQLTISEGSDYEPTFSPDGLKIAFTSERDGNREIYIMSNEGLELKNLSNNSQDDWKPKFFPDSKKIIFQSLRDGENNWEIYIMNTDGSDQRNLTNHPRTDYSYVILPLKNP